MDPLENSLECCFGRHVWERLSGPEPHHEYRVTSQYREGPNETEFVVSWVGSEEEIPQWLANETYEVEPRWVRHFIRVVASGNIQGVAVFDRPEVRELALRYCDERYGKVLGD